jgi:hypothetical protein
MNQSCLFTIVAALIAGTVATSRTASADEAAPADRPVDVALLETPSPHRTFSIEWNPLALFIDRLSANVVITPGDHHALVVSPFYTWTTTAEYSTSLNADGTPLVNSAGQPYELNVPSQSFKGFGGEIGYRYYFAEGGPRGVFLGPSLILGLINAKAYDGNETSVFDLGFAGDVGYEALVGDTISITAGAGLQYTFPNKYIPDQQLPTEIYVNKELHPRLLLSLGYAF